MRAATVNRREVKARIFTILSPQIHKIFTSLASTLRRQIIIAQETEMKTLGSKVKLGMTTGILGLSLALTGCGDSGSSDADLRVIHASKDAPPVNVRVDNRTVISSLDYADSSGYVEVRSGTQSVVVEAIIPGGNADVITVPGLQLRGDERYNVLALNDTASIDALVVAESTASPSSSEVAIAVVHASTNAGAVDVYVTAPC
jgi:hypothetical protein